MKVLYPELPILMVDDEARALSSMDSLLKINGFTNTVVCDDSRKVSKLLEDTPFSLILLDLSMPGLSGTEILRAMSERKSRPPVIVVTAHNSFRTAIECLKLGADNYLIKPVEKEELLINVRRSIDFGYMRKENAVFRDLLLSDRLSSTECDAFDENASVEFLIKAREEYKSLFQTMLTPSFVTDLSNHTCLYRNRAYREFVEKHGGNPGLRPCFITSLHDEYRAILEKRCRDHGEVTGLEVRGSFVDGREYIVILSGRYLSDEGILQGSFLDVTEQRVLEERYRKVRNLEGLSGVIGGVAHDFGNVLTAISGYAELIEIELEILAANEAGSPFRALDDIKQLRGLVDRGRALTDTLLQSGDRKNSDAPESDVNTVVEEVVDSKRPLLASGVEMILDLEDDLPPVRAGGEPLRQIITNALDNARDALDETGSITIRTCRLHRSDSVEKGWVIMEIIDTGIGIPAKDLELVFEPFHTTKKTGTGLGLPTVKRILGEIGGNIELKSVPGAGTGLRILLPIAGAPDGAPSGGRSERIYT